MAFPTVTLLDSMIRAAENPLNNSGKWKALGGEGENNNAGHISSEEWLPNSTFAAGKEDGAYWTLVQYANPAVAFEFHVASSNERYLALWCCLSSPTTSAKNGYRLRVIHESVAGKCILRLEKITASAASTLVEKTKVAFAVGDRFGLTCEGGKVKAWQKSGAGVMTEVMEAADSSYTEGYVGIAGDGNLIAARNFEAGGSVIHLPHELTVTQGGTAKLARKPARTLAPTQAESASLTARIGLHEVLSTTQASVATLTEVVKKAEKEEGGAGLEIRQAAAAVVTS